MLALRAKQTPDLGLRATFLAWARGQLDYMLGLPFHAPTWDMLGLSANVTQGSERWAGASVAGFSSQGGACEGGACSAPPPPPATAPLSLPAPSRSYMVGFGANPPRRVHHAGASCPDPPAPCDLDEYESGAPNPQVGGRHKPCTQAAGDPAVWVDESRRLGHSGLGAHTDDGRAARPRSRRCWRGRWWAGRTSRTRMKTPELTTNQSGWSLVAERALLHFTCWPTPLLCLLLPLTPLCHPFCPSTIPRSEVALDYNGGLTGALAGLIELLPTVASYLPLGEWE